MSRKQRTIFLFVSRGFNALAFLVIILWISSGIQDISHCESLDTWFTHCLRTIGYEPLVALFATAGNAIATWIPRFSGWNDSEQPWRTDSPHPAPPNRHNFGVIVEIVAVVSLVTILALVAILALVLMSVAG